MRARSSLYTSPVCDMQNSNQDGGVGGWLSISVGARTNVTARDNLTPGTRVD